MFYRFALIAVVMCMLTLAASSARALVIDYDASVAPDAISPDRFSFIVFGDTSYAASAGQLTLSTYYGEGIWFGNGTSHGIDPVGWTLADDSVGNYLSLTFKLSAGATEWNDYLDDGAYGASIGLSYDHITYSRDDGGGFYDVDVPIDLVSDFHTLELLLKDGIVTYRLDHSQVLYSGPAFATPSRILVIGDGSGSTISGTGSMIIDHVTYISAPDFQIPEPASLGLLALGSLTLLRRRRAAA